MWRQEGPKSTPSAALRPATTHTWTAWHLLLSGHVATAASQAVMRLQGLDVRRSAGWERSGGRCGPKWRRNCITPLVLLHPSEENTEPATLHFWRLAVERSFRMCRSDTESQLCLISQRHAAASMHHFPAWKNIYKVHEQNLSMKAENPLIERECDILFPFLLQFLKALFLKYSHFVTTIKAFSYIYLKPPWLVTSHFLGDRMYKFALTFYF